MASVVEIISPAPNLVEITGNDGQSVDVPAAPPAIVEVVAEGIQGPPGPGNASQRIDVPFAAATWTVPHLLNKVPQVQVFLANGEAVIADIEATPTVVTITFAQAQRGFVLLT